MVSDALSCFSAVQQAGCIHQPFVTGSGPQSAQHPALTWVNTILGNVKRSFHGTYHHFSSKHLPRYLPSSPTASAAASRSGRCFPASHSSPCEPRRCLTERSSWLRTISEQDELVESGAGAPTLGSGGDSGAFVPGLSPAPIVTFPAPALRTRRADFRHRALQWDHAPRTRTARAIWACRWSADAARLPLCIPTPSPARRRACSRLDNIEPVRFDSLTYACDASGIIALIAGSRHRHSRRPSSFRHRSTPEVPFLDRHYPASSVVRTSPPPRPAQPAPHGVPVGACHTTDRASRVAPIPLFHACRRQYPGGTSRCACRSLPGQWQPSPTYRRVGLPHSRFRGLLSVHSRCGPHGRWITLGDPLHRSASNDVVTSIIRSDCYRLERQFAGRDSHPLRDGAFPRHTVRNQDYI